MEATCLPAGCHDVLMNESGPWRWIKVGAVLTVLAATVVRTTARDVSTFRSKGGAVPHCDYSDTSANE